MLHRLSRHRALRPASRPPLWVVAVLLLGCIGSALAAPDAPEADEPVDPLIALGLEPAPPPPPPEVPLAERVPRVELVFVGVSEDVYSLYGHAAMLVVDDPDVPVEDAELFNFGVTAFTEDDYVQKFLGGRVEFWGDSRRYGRQLRRWIKADRTVSRRPVNLSVAATERLITHLRLDITRERRDYVYDTFRENCATRLRDYLDLYTGGAVYGALGPIATGESFRDDVRVAYAGLPPLLLLTEVVPGIELDRGRTLWEQAYLPAALFDGLGMVTTERGPLLGETIIDHARGGDDPRAGWPLIGQALIAGWAALLLLLALLLPRLSRRVRGAVLALHALAVTGLGLLLIVVGLGSDWPDMQRNWLLLAAPPTDLLLLIPAFALLRNRPAGGGITRAYLGVRLALAALLLVLTPWSAVEGPVAPRLAALFGVVLAWRALERPAAVQRPRRLVGQPAGVTSARRATRGMRRECVPVRTCAEV